MQSRTLLSLGVQKAADDATDVYHEVDVVVPVEFEFACKQLVFVLERAYLGKHMGQEFQCAHDHVEVGLDLDWCSILKHTPERVLGHENGFYLNDMNQNSGHLISGVI